MKSRFTAVWTGLGLALVVAAFVLAPGWELDNPGAFVPGFVVFVVVSVATVIAWVAGLVVFAVGRRLVRPG